MKLKLGLVGLSSDWQKRYLPSLRVLKDRFEVTGVYSSVSARADNVAREFAATRYDGYREMIKQDDIDAVMMLSSDWFGIGPIEAACDYGKAIYCGSEIDFDPEQATQLTQSVDLAGIAFMAEFPRRYAPASLRLKELIATQLGQPQLLFCHRRLPSLTPDEQRSARSATIRSKRELMELVDWCAYIVGRSPNSVQSSIHRQGKQLESTGSQATTDAGSTHRSNPDSANSDYQMLSVDFSAPDDEPGSTIAQISCGSYIRPTWREASTFRPPAAAQVSCENGVAFVDLPSGLTWFDDAGRHQESLDSEMAVGQQLLTQFHRAVTSLVRKMGDLEDVTVCLNTLQAARESVDQRRLIDIP